MIAPISCSLDLSNGILFALTCPMVGQDCPDTHSWNVSRIAFVYKYIHLLNRVLSKPVNCRSMVDLRVCVTL